MKRCGEEFDDDPQFKLSVVSSQGEASGQPPVSGEARGEGIQALTMNDTLSYLKTIKGIFQDEMDKYLKFLQVIKDFKAERLDPTDVMAQLKELFRGHRNLILGFNVFMPGSFKIMLPHEASVPPPKKSVDHYEAFKFIYKIRTRFQNDHRVYLRFLNTLNLNVEEKKLSFKDVYEKVCGLLSDHQDLIDEFKLFLRDPPPPCPTEQVPSNRNSSFPLRDRRTSPTHTVPDPLEHQDCNPSYRFQPNNCPMSRSSHQEKIGDEVLNISWLSVTSSSGTVARRNDFNFKQRAISEQEESLFRCEDDKFELDMLLNLLQKTQKKAVKLLGKINNNTVVLDKQFCIERHLKAPILKCIERLYGDHGLDVIDILRENVTSTLNVILPRLNQKIEECSRFHSDCDKVWKEVYAKYNSKALDLHSSNFTQQGTKRLSTNDSLAEVKEINENDPKNNDVRQLDEVMIKEINENDGKDEDVLIKVSTGNQQPLTDSDIHEDL